MDIDKLAIDSGPSIYYDDAFRAVLEDHMSYLRSHPDTMIFPIEQNIADRWAGDLFGLLTSMKVEAYLHWVIMRMNMIYNPTDTNMSLTSLIIPSSKVLDTIKNIHKTKSKIK